MTMRAFGFRASGAGAMLMTVVTCALTAAGPVCAGGGECEPTWVPTFGEVPGVDDDIEAMAVFDDGTGPALYVGGEFDRAGGVPVNGLAKWDGERWSDVGGGTNGTVRALTVWDDGSGPALYVGGSFQSVGGPESGIFIEALAKWDGTSWSDVGDAFVNGGFVWSLEVFDDGSGSGEELYVGGFFTEVGGSVPANRIAKWNGATWSALGGGMANGPGGQVRALQVFDDGSGNGPQLYAAGSFLDADGVTVNRVAKWDHVAGSWSGLGDGLNTHVWDLEVYDDGSGAALYAAGEFRFSGAVSVDRVARWDPDTSTWSAPGGGITGSGTTLVRSLAVFDGAPGHEGTPVLVAAGNFDDAGAVEANNIAFWDGAAWTEYPNGINNTIHVLAQFDVDGQPGDELFAGGAFIAAGFGVITDRIAQWNGGDEQWIPLGTAPTNGARALVTFDDGSGDGPQLHAGGLFVTADAVPLFRVGKWSTSDAAWSDLDGGTNFTTVDDLVVFDDGTGEALFAVGNFTSVGGTAGSGGITVNRVAKWDGAAWSALGGATVGTSGTVHAAAVFDDGTGPALYVAGNFTSAGGVPANRIARWDGKAWTALGSGLDNTANNLIVHDDGTGAALYVGGGFITAGGVTVNRIAKWDGATWSGLGSPVPGVPALVTGFGVYDDGDGEALYVSFDNAMTSNGVLVNRITKWDGANWHPLGEGLNHTAGGMTVYDDGAGDGPALFVVGAFTEAGGEVVNFIAKWNGADWSPLAGGGVDGIVSELHVFDDGLEDGPSLYIAGSFINSPGGDGYLAKYVGCPAPGLCLADLVSSDTFQPPPDGQVDGADLAFLLGEWGRVPGGGSPADIVTSATFQPPPDGQVDGADLAFLLGEWGGCD